MTSDRPGSLAHVPTLTEVVGEPVPPSPVRTDGAGPAAPEPPEPLPSEPAPSEPIVAAPAAGPEAELQADAAHLLPSEEALTASILASLQRQIDAALEFQVRELLTPILNRATDAVVREAKSELARSLRDLVARSVAEEMRRQRLR
ncbi:MAG: hypothetical protein ACREXI_13970 [Caldimonas sp.]